MRMKKVKSQTLRTLCTDKNIYKDKLKNLLGLTLGNVLSFFFIDIIFNKTQKPYIRAVNYHGTPETDKYNFEKHLIWYKAHFADCNFRCH